MSIDINAALAQLLAAGGETIVAANDALVTEQNAVALPDHFKLHDLEAYLPLRRRMRGAMRTYSITDFADYVNAHAMPGATVFVDADAMQAAAVLNLGRASEPGHADNTAVLAAKRTAAMTALLQATSRDLSQTEAAEWLEDWAENLACRDSDDKPVALPQAAAALRSITIEQVRKLESDEGNLSASRGVLESMRAGSKLPIPVALLFACEPHLQMAKRAFALRLGVVAGGDKPKIKLRIIAMERHTEEMAEEMADNVRAELATRAAPVQVLRGTFSRGQ